MSGGGEDKGEQEEVSGSARKAMEKSGVSYLCMRLFIYGPLTM